MMASITGFCLILGDVTNRRSPRPLCASLVRSSTSSFRRALNNTRGSLSISPVVHPGEKAYSNAPGSPQNQLVEKNLDLDSNSINATQDLLEDDPLDMQEVRKTVLCILTDLGPDLGV